MNDTSRGLSHTLYMWESDGPDTPRTVGRAGYAGYLSRARQGDHTQPCDQRCRARVTSRSTLLTRLGCSAHEPGREVPHRGESHVPEPLACGYFLVSGCVAWLLAASST